MPAEKAKRNKTIDISIEEGREYLDRCVNVSGPQPDLSRITDKTIAGDMLCVLPMLPPKSVDLIIADPPYNLSLIHISTSSMWMTR